MTGMGRCTECGGAIIAMTRGHGKKRGHFYGCGYNHKRGASVCSNPVQIRQEILDAAVLDAIARALDERVVEAAVDEALYLLRNSRKQKLDRRTAIERELSLIERHQRNLIEAIKQGQPTESLVVALKAEEDRKNVLARELNALGNLEKVISLDAHRIKKEVIARATDVRSLLGRRGPQA